MAQNHENVAAGKATRTNVPSRRVEDDAHVMGQVSKRVLGRGQNLL